MTLLEQLDHAMPGWRLEYDNDPMAAALDLGLIEHEDVEAVTDYRPLNFNDTAAAWQRLEQERADNADHGADDES
jgi:hypothetical protein